MATHNSLGKKGEEIAKTFLQGLGYKILDCNWHFKHTEIDIIAMDRDTLAVVEVKTRAYKFQENLCELVGVKKQRTIIQAANAYVESKGLTAEVRFDIIFIVMPNETYTLEHVKDAFTPYG
jgi:putative endonuclease